LQALALGAAASTGCPRLVQRTGAAHRVVTLGPNATEILFALGEGDKLVGISRYDDYPREVARLPRVGGLLDPSFEAIVALRPDAVIGARGPVNRAVLARLEALGVRVLFPPVESLAQVRAAIGQFAALVGAAARAPPLVAEIDRRVQRVRAAVAGRTAPLVLVVLGQRPISVAGPGSFLDELVGIAGGRNVVRAGPRWPTLALEAVLALAPDVVLDVTAMDGHGALREAWAAFRAVPAVRNERVVPLTDAMVSRPGPRVGEAAAAIARALHPGLAV
jgi:iron complex transport system substrate-binding protein